MNKVFRYFTEKKNMKYHSQLIEATLLKRPISFLMEVVLQSKRRIMVRCPNLGPLTGCDILGTQLWFSAPSNGHCLPTLELVEVNGGHLVGINSEILKLLVVEAINTQAIPELINYNIKTHDLECQQDNILTLTLHRNLLEHCYVCLEHVIYTNEQLEALFPCNPKFIDLNLDYLMLRKRQGHRAILIYCVMHSDAKTLKFLTDNFYIAKVKQAIQQGVEILAYKASISTKEIKINNKISIGFQAIAKL